MPIEKNKAKGLRGPGREPVVQGKAQLASWALNHGWGLAKPGGREVGFLVEREAVSQGRGPVANTPTSLEVPGPRTRCPLLGPRL